MLTPDATVSVTVKSLKPALQIPLTVSLSDSVADLKKAVADANALAPVPDLQRLVLKGKALADAKLLKEYDLADGAVITLMAKAAPPAPAPSQTASELGKGATMAPGRPSHLRAPSLTITTTDELDIDAEFASDVSPEPPSPVSGANFHRTLSSPDFWHKVHALCQDEFATEAEADTVFDNFLMSVKNRLSASETAKIRDEVGITGEHGEEVGWRGAWEADARRHAAADDQVWVEASERTMGTCRQATDINPPFHRHFRHSARIPFVDAVHWRSEE